VVFTLFTSMSASMTLPRSFDGATATGAMSLLRSSFVLLALRGVLALVAILGLVIGLVPVTGEWMT